MTMKEHTSGTSLIGVAEKYFFLRKFDSPQFGSLLLFFYLFQHSYTVTRYSPIQGMPLTSSYILMVYAMDCKRNCTVMQIQIKIRNEIL